MSENIPEGLAGDLEESMKSILDLHKRYLSIFEWQDGPLVQAMRNGSFILLDEIIISRGCRS